jgi:hypothetical protein
MIIKMVGMTAKQTSGHGDETAGVDARVPIGRAVGFGGGLVALEVEVTEDSMIGRGENRELLMGGNRFALGARGKVSARSAEDDAGRKAAASIYGAGRGTFIGQSARACLVAGRELGKS